MHQSNSYRFVLLLTGIVALLVTPSLAHAVTLTPADDTYLTEHSGLGGPNSTHGSDTSLFATYFGTNFGSAPLVRFDLTAYAGQIVTEPATLSMYVQGTAAWPQSTRTLNVYRKDAAWNSATATYSNTSLDVAVDGYLGFFTLDYPTPGDRYVSKTIDASVIQGWIDAPATNQGVFMILDSNGFINDLQFGSMESANPPTLTFAVPEPASLGLIGLGSLIMLRRRLDA